MNKTTTAIKPPFILVDGSSYLFRAFHALPPLSTSSGQPTGAIKGVVSMLRKILNEYEPTHMAVVFDAKGKTFRHEQYPKYKANRPPMPLELANQIKPLHHIIKAMGLPLLTVEGVEADDVIATLATAASHANINTLISTGDKDMAQLVNDQVTLINTMDNQQLDNNAVQEKFGVPPRAIVDYLSLLGDKVDNVPGLPGVGDKTARTLLAHYESIEAVIEAGQAVSELKIRGAKTLPKKILDHREQLLLAKKLVTLKLNVDLSAEPQDLQLKPSDQGQLKKLYTDLEFKSWLKEMQSDVKPSPNINKNYRILTTKTTALELLETLKKTNIFALDTETSSLDYMSADLVGLSFSINPHEAYYIPVGHTILAEHHDSQLDRDWVLSTFKPLLESDSKQKIGQNIKFDMNILARYNIQLRGIHFDTMLESYVFNSIATRHNMDALALKYLEHKTIAYEDIAGKGAKQLSFDQIPIEQAGPYAAEDADITLQLHQLLWSKLSPEPHLKTVFETIEMPLVPVLSAMERNGTLIDPKQLEQHSTALTKSLQGIEEKIHTEAGEVFNIDSTKQLSAILYDKLQLPILKKTPKGAPSTAESVLQELASSYLLPSWILEYRSLSKLKSTYTDKLPLLIHPQTKRVHTSYHQAVAATGRLSSSNPNLQNIPIKTEEGRKIRQAFIAQPGYSLLACDYSQIELRIMAHLSNDSRLIQAFAENQDIHTATAAEVFSVPAETVTKTQRRNAKAINFGLIYGMSAFGLARQLGINRTKAQSYIDTYFERYKGVKKYMETTRALAHQQGHVETLFGRRLYLPDINASNKMRQQAAERTAINAPMQGSAADIIKRAMIKIHQWLQEKKSNTLMLMQVHDELVFEVPEEELDEMIEKIPEMMETASELSVPLSVDAGTGSNWDEAH